MKRQNEFPFRENVRAWLEENGYDGFYCSHDDCACDTDDLAPCCEIKNIAEGDCKAGYKVSKPCYNGDGDMCDWGIFPERPGVEE